MPRNLPASDRWLSLEAVEAAVPAMTATDTAAVARGAKPSKQTAVGFIEAYRFAEGDPEAMAELPATTGQTWAQRRAGFVSRHVAQMQNDANPDGFYADGTPTKRLLSLIAWAYVPQQSERKVRAWFQAGCPVGVKKRRNPPQTRRVNDEYTVYTFPPSARRNPAEDSPGQVGLFTPKALGNLVVEHFASGSNHPGEIRGFAALGKPVGVAAKTLGKAAGGHTWRTICKRDCETALVEAVHMGVPVFIDSGAFSEVGFGPQGPYTVAPIEHDDWLDRLGIYERVVDGAGPDRAHLVNIVAPDKVADQGETLARMRRYRAWIQRLAQKGASVLVPIQKGSMTLAEFHDAAADALDIDRWAPTFIPAIPMKKDATSPGDLERYLRARTPHRIHLLGIGPTSEKATAVAAAIRRGSPQTAVQGDSVLIRAKVGRASGLGPLTKEQDDVREAVAEHRFLDYPDEFRTKEGAGLADYTTMITEPGLWTSKAARQRVADAVGLTGADKKAWIEAPNSTIQRGYEYRWDNAGNEQIALTNDPAAEPLYLAASFDEALEAEWHRYAARIEATPVKRIAIEGVFGREGAGPTAEYTGPVRRNDGQTSLLPRRERLQREQRLPLPPEAEKVARRLARQRPGSVQLIAAASEIAALSTLRRLGYIDVVETVHPSESLFGREAFKIRTRQKLHDAIAATQAAREAEREEFQQVGLFGRRNPRKRKSDGEQTRIFGALRPPAPAVVEPGSDLFAEFSPLGAPAPGERGHKPRSQTPLGAWDGQHPYALATRMLYSAATYLRDPETRWAYDAAMEGRSEDAEADGEILLTLADMVGVPYHDGAGDPMSESYREEIALAAMHYVMESDVDYTGGTEVDDVIDPGKSRKGPARPRVIRDDAGTLPFWAGWAILGDKLASLTAGYSTKLRLGNVSKDVARRFIEMHHSALPYLRTNGLMYAIGAFKGNRLVAVATAGSPTGKWGRGGGVDIRNVVELSRVASDGSVKGAASKLVSRLMDILEQSRRGDPNSPVLLVTYQLSSEDGSSYKALKDRGLRPVAFQKGAKKASGARAGTEGDRALATADKIRWEYSPIPGVALPAKWHLIEKQPDQVGLIPRPGSRRSR